MNIVRAEKKHISQMADIERLSFPDPWSEAAFESSISSQAEIILAAVENDIVCGYVIGNCDGYQGYIENIAVSPLMRKKGTGRALLKAFSEHLPETAEEIVLEVRQSNPARDFYRALGFEEIGTRKNFYSDPKEDGIVMIKSLKEDKNNER